MQFSAYFEICSTVNLVNNNKVLYWFHLWFKLVKLLLSKIVKCQCVQIILALCRLMKTLDILIKSSSRTKEFDWPSLGLKSCSRILCRFLE